MNEISDTINNESNIEIISLKNTNDHEDLCSICLENIIDNNISLPCEHSFIHPLIMILSFEFLNFLSLFL